MSTFTPEQIEWRRNLSAALRSGKYEQGQGRLRTKEGKFCCLGVACDLLAPESWIFHADGEPTFSDRNSLQCVYPPQYVATAFGFPYEKLTIDSAPQFGVRLADLNDNKGKSFAEIADVLDAETDAAIQAMTASGAAK